MHHKVPLILHNFYLSIYLYETNSNGTYDQISWTDRTPPEQWTGGLLIITNNLLIIYVKFTTIYERDPK